jgi:hypothetical protein
MGGLHIEQIFVGLADCNHLGIILLLGLDSRAIVKQLLRHTFRRMLGFVAWTGNPSARTPQYFEQERRKLFKQLGIKK